MVLGKLRVTGTTDDEPESVFAPEDPLTFPELLEVQRRRFGQKVLLQTKTRREWRRYTHAETFVPGPLPTTDTRTRKKVGLFVHEVLSFVYGALELSVTDFSAM